MNLRNRKIVRTVQVVFGLFLIFLALNSFFPFLPAPQFNEAGTAFLGALFNTGYMFYIMSIIFIISGLMFILDRWSAFGVVLLAPIVVNILLFHIFLDFTGWLLAFIVAILEIYLGVIHWPRYKPMLAR